MKPVLIIIDMQKDFFKKEELESQSQTLVNNINDLISKFRKSKLPIIWIKQTWKPDLSDAHLGNKRSGKKLVIEGTEGNQLLNKLDYRDDDYLVIKKRYSGFFKTTLESLLKEIKSNTLIICGINTHACVRMTVIDAYQRDYNVIIAKDCVGSYNKEHHDVSMKYFSPTIAQIKSNKDIFKLLK